MVVVGRLTIRHDRDHQFGVGDVGAAHLRATYLLTHLRHHTPYLVCTQTAHIGHVYAHTWARECLCMRA